MGTDHCPRCGESLSQRKVEGKKRLYCQNCSEVIWRNPKPVAWVLVKKDDKYLLVKRTHNPDKGEWDIPGGFLEEGESFRDAAVRELEEETGVEINIDKLSFYNTISFERGEKPVVGVIFRVELNNIPEIKAQDDAEKALFWSIEDFEGSNEELREVCKQFFKQ